MTIDKIKLIFVFSIVSAFTIISTSAFSSESGGYGGVFHWITYNGSVSPNEAGWAESGNGNVSIITPGILNFTKSSDSHHYYYKADGELNNSIGSTMEARIKVTKGGYNSADNFYYGASFDIRDNKKMAGMAIGENVIQIGNDLYNFSTMDDFHTYRITLRNNEARYFVDGKLLTAANPPANSGDGIFFLFAVSTSSSTEYAESLWDYVRYSTDMALDPQPPIYLSSNVTVGTPFTATIFNDVKWLSIDDSVQDVVLETNATSDRIARNTTICHFGNPGGCGALATTLPAGTYYWKSYANDTLGLMGSSSVNYFTIQPAWSQTTDILAGANYAYSKDSRGYNYGVPISVKYNVSERHQYTDDTSTVGGSVLSTMPVNITWTGHDVDNSTIFYNVTVNPPRLDGFWVHWYPITISKLGKDEFNITNFIYGTNYFYGAYPIKYEYENIAMAPDSRYSDSWFVNTSTHPNDWLYTDANITVNNTDSIPYENVNWNLLIEHDPVESGFWIPFGVNASYPGNLTFGYLNISALESKNISARFRVPAPVGTEYQISPSSFGVNITCSYGYCNTTKNVKVAVSVSPDWINYELYEIINNTHTKLTGSEYGFACVSNACNWTIPSFSDHNYTVNSSTPKPPDTKTCPDGSVVPVNSDCPSPPSGGGGGGGGFFNMPKKTTANTTNSTNNLKPTLPKIAIEEKNETNTVENNENMAAGPTGSFLENTASFLSGIIGSMSFSLPAVKITENLLAVMVMITMLLLLGGYAIRNKP